GLSVPIVRGGQGAYEAIIGRRGLSVIDAGWVEIAIWHAYHARTSSKLEVNYEYEMPRAATFVNAPLSIGEVAAATGFRTSAIRYYEDAGILPRPDRVSGKRRYHADTVDRLILIRFCSRLGIRLADVRGLLATTRGSRA